MSDLTSSTSLVNPARHRPQILSWRAVETKTIKAWFDVGLPSGLIIRDCKLLVGPLGKRFIGMPGVQMTNSDGSPRLNPQGKKVYKNFVDFRDRQTGDRFREGVLEVLKEEHPEAFEDDTFEDDFLR